MSTAATELPLILASSSPYRCELLGRLGLPFETAAPEVDESRLDNEPAAELVRRLSEAKAQAIGISHRGLIIGSDQVATVGESILGKPGTHERAMEQLGQLSGQRVTFLTGLCLLNSVTGEQQLDMVPFFVTFRALDRRQIERYLETEHPYNCAGSFKSEGLGITLFQCMEGDDPTALIGLPLISLTSMLSRAGVELP